MSEQRFPKTARLLATSEFDRVFAARVSAGNRWLVVHGAGNELDGPRLGLAVSRRCGNAVGRNRWKRLLREAFRLSRQQLPPLDLVCVPKQPTVPALPQVRLALCQLAEVVAAKLERSRRQQQRDRKGGDP